MRTDQSWMRPPVAPAPPVQQPTLVSQPVSSGYQQWIQTRPQPTKTLLDLSRLFPSPPAWWHPQTTQPQQRQQEWDQRMQDLLAAPPTGALDNWKSINLLHPDLFAHIPWVSDLPPTVRNSPQFQKWYTPYWIKYQASNFNPIENPNQALAFLLLGAGIP